MEAFPFTNTEWDSLKPVVESFSDAVLAHDDVLTASLRLDMLDLLAGLQERHGDHPVLLETMGDFTDDAAEQVSLYRRALEIAGANGLPTLSIRLALTHVLVHGFGDSVAAMQELQACGGDVIDGSETERSEWASLLKDTAIEANAIERASLFGRAMEIAMAHGQSTLRLRLLLIRFLLDEGQSEAAREELLACEVEVSDGDLEDSEFWAALCEEASQA